MSKASSSQKLKGQLPFKESAPLLKALDLYVRIGLGQLEQLTEFMRFDTWQRPPLLPSAPWERWSYEEMEHVEELLKTCKTSVLGFHPNASLGIGNPAVDITVRRAYEWYKVLSKIASEAREPAPQFRGVSYDGLTVRYTHDPAPGVKLFLFKDASHPELSHAQVLEHSFFLLEGTADQWVALEQAMACACTLSANDLTFLPTLLEDGMMGVDAEKCSRDAGQDLWSHLDLVTGPSFPLDKRHSGTLDIPESYKNLLIVYERVQELRANHSLAPPSLPSPRKRSLPRSA